MNFYPIDIFSLDKGYGALKAKLGCVNYLYTSAFTKLIGLGKLGNNKDRLISK